MWMRGRYKPTFLIENPIRLRSQEVLMMSVREYADQLVVERSAGTGAGRWSDWWGECTAGCGLCGHLVRQRKCLGPGECR